MQISSDWEVIWRQGPRANRQAEGVCKLLDSSLETGWMRWESRAAKSLRTPSAAGQATSEKTKLPCQGMSSHRRAEKKERNRL